MKRLPFLDHARGLIILLVALQHATQTYALYWGGNKFFVSESLAARSSLFDGLFMWTDAFIMQSLFLIAGIFIIPSYERINCVDFWKRKFIRIIAPWAVAVLTLAPMLSFIKHLQSYDPFANYWDYLVHTHFANYIPQAGYWFLSYLTMLSAIALLVYKKLPWLYHQLNALVIRLVRKPWIFVLSLSALFSVLVTLSDVWYGTPYWSSIFSLFVARSNMMYTYVASFFLGVGINGSGILNNDRLLARWAEKWLVWCVGFVILSLIYIYYCANFISAGSITDQLIMARHDGVDYAGMCDLWTHYLPLILPRTLMHGVLIVVQFGALLTSLYHFTNSKTKGFWPKLGMYSYGIYFFHEQICVLVQYGLVGTDYPVIVKWLCAFSLSVIGSSLITRVLRQLPVLNRVF